MTRFGRMMMAMGLGLGLVAPAVRPVGAQEHGAPRTAAGVVQDPNKINIQHHIGNAHALEIPFAFNNLDRPGVDQLWAYAEQEPSRGVSVFQLRFAGEILQNVEVSRDALIMGTARADNRTPEESQLGSGSVTTKRFP